jgi:uncharacterized protein (DUF427 family)
MEGARADHIRIEPEPGRVRILLGETVIARSDRALRLTEGSYPPVLYVPREDVRMARLKRTERRSHCPYKGDASYYTIEGDGGVARDAAWSYETPFDAMAAIAGHLAFYPDKVTIEQAR